ncbi:MAG: DUF4845 domain-containing protein [Pseudomonadota bacterium]
MHNKNPITKQKGGSVLGMLIVVAAIVFLGMIGLKVIPAYLEYMSVKSAVKKISNNENFDSMNKKEIADSFNRFAEVDNITVVKGNDLVVEKTSTGNIISTQYQVVVPIMANASVLLDFNATSAK